MDLSQLSEKEAPKAWIPFGDDEVLISYISRQDLKKLLKKAKRSTFISHQKVEKVDDELADQLLGEAVVKDWKGFTMKKKSYPCTPENIAFLMLNWSSFSAFVNQACTDLQLFAEKEKEEVEKN
ncbi:MAG: hypothetical protein JRE23_00220 [Deltaproteobacteria bacterium]|nr:hypothetical protein [Deltaproteobacteria bacterium]